MTVDEIAEDYSSRTCSHCSYINNYAPKGRTFSCPRCGAVIHRDVNGSANICSRFAFGSYGFVQPHPLMCLRPLRRSRAFGTGQGIYPLVACPSRNPTPLGVGSIRNTTSYQFGVESGSADASFTIRYVKYFYLPVILMEFSAS